MTVINLASLASAVTSGPSGPPAWASGTAYSVNQLVSNAGTTYICTTAHTSGTSFDSTKFAVLGGPTPPPTGLTGSNAYDPLRSIYNGKAAALRRLRAALTKAESGQDLGRIWCLGDSITAGTGSNPAVGSYPVYLRKALAALGYSTAGTGLALANPAFDPPFVDSRWSSSGSVTTSFLNFQSYTGASGASFTFASDIAGTVVNIYYQDQNGPWTYSIDGGAAVTVTPGSTFNLRRVQVTGLANTTHTIVISSTVAGVGAVIAGVEVTNSFGLEVSNLGLPGITTAQWLQGFPGGAQAYPQNFVAAMSAQLGIVPDFAFLCLGVNDANQSVTTATYTANMTTIINDLTSRGSGVAIVIPMTPALPTDGQSLSMTAALWLNYRQAMYALSDSLGVPLVDLSDRGGPFATANTNRLMYNQVGSVNGTVGTLPAPTGVTATPVAGGGTFAAGTYFYKVSALNSAGETLPSAEVSAAIALNGSATISWTAVSGATGYRVYRGTAAGGENVFYAPGNVTTFTDVNGASTAGSPLVTATAGTTSVTNWLNQAPPYVGAPLLGQGLNSKFVTGGISGVPGSWNFTTSLPGGAGTGQIQVGPNSDGFHPSPAGYSFMANALAALANA